MSTYDCQSLYFILWDSFITAKESQKINEPQLFFSVKDNSRGIIFKNPTTFETSKVMNQKAADPVNFLGVIMHR